MSKQTSVEWLIVQIINDHNNNALTGLEWKKIFEQARAMEREQIIDAVSRGWWNNENGLVSWIGEQYYNETYKK